MALRLLPWLAGSAMLLAACGGGAQNLATTRPTAPRSSRGGTSTSTTVSPAPAPNLTPWGSPPVVAPPELMTTANAYYDGAGPAPESASGVRPACLLLLPTALSPARVKPVPSSRFNVFGEFVVRWAPATRRGTALTLTVLPPGDSSDRYYFGPAAQVMTFADGSALRTAPEHSRGVLLQVANQNCEYVVQPGAAIPPDEDSLVLLSLRLVFAP